MFILYLQKVIAIIVVFIIIILISALSDHKSNSKPTTRIKNAIKENQLVLATVAIFLIAFTQVHVASGSMEPTLMTGDRGMLLDTVFGYKPQRGDIVGFNVGSEIWVKRVIGLPGDTIEFNAGQVYINGELLVEEYLVDNTYTWSGNNTKYVVPAGKLFLMGDNRNNSNDSRYWDDPFVSVSKILGKYAFTIFHAN